MKYPSEIISNAENRIVSFFAHLKEVVTNESVSYSPDMFPWTKEVIGELLTLDHQDFLKAQIFIGFKLSQHARWIEGLSLSNDNIFGRALIEAVKSVDNNSVGQKLLTAVIDGGVYGINDLEQLNDPAFYNWFGKNYDREPVVAELRTVWANSINTDVRLNGHEVNFPHALPLSDIDQGLMFRLVANGAMLNIKPDHFYVVTDSTVDCMISAAEPYDIRKHHKLIRGDRLNGWMFKMRNTDKGSIIAFICNGLEMTNYRYDVKLLGLDLV